MTTYGITLPIHSKALTQYILPGTVTGAAMLHGQPVVATSDGIHILDNPVDDTGQAISAWFKTVRSDFGMHNRKRFRTVYIRGLIEKLAVTLDTADGTDTDGTSPVMTYQSSDGSLKQEEGYFPGRRDQAATWWQLKIANVAGEDFSVDAVEVLPVILQPKRGRFQR
jgi:hypothetical protein